MNRPTRIVLCMLQAVLIFAAIAVCCHSRGASPTPFDASHVDTSTISEADIQKTIAHRNALQEQLKSGLTNQAGSLSNAAANAKTADTELKAYQAKVDKLAITAAQDHDKVLAQKAALLRRDIIIGVMTLAIAGYAFAKFYLHLPI